MKRRNLLPLTFFAFLPIFTVIAFFNVSCKNGVAAAAKISINTNVSLNSIPVPGNFTKLQTAGTGLPDLPVYIPSGVINLNGSHDTVISGISINAGKVPAINLINCYNVRITGNKLYNSTDVGIQLFNCKNITIENNFFTNLSTGVYAVQITEGGIVVNNNQFLNMKGPFPRGQFVQFDTVSGPGCSISYNKGENIFGQSYPEDAINLYKSNGTADSPIKITGNWIRGGGPSKTGGGIMLGDNGGSFETASDNILVDPGQYGMAIAGGDHNSIINNLVYGRSQYFTNVGVYLRGTYGYKCTNSSISGNKVKFINYENYENDGWIGPRNPRPAGWGTNIFGAHLDATILPPVIVSND